MSVGRGDNHGSSDDPPEPQTPHPPIPDDLRARYAAWKWRIAAHGTPHSITFRLTRPGHRARYAKVVASCWWPTPQDEARRLEWAKGRLPVPLLIDEGQEEGVSWMVTEELAGVDATAESLRADPGRLVELLADGLRAFHSIPAAGCPFDFTLDAALDHVARRAAAGAIDAERDFHPEHAHLTVAEAMHRLMRDRPDGEDRVVCHGDYCHPNVLIAGDRVSGFVDLGELGVADRWWDLAVATWSTDWNLGAGYEDRFLAAYGITADPDRITYYRLLYDLVS